MVRLNTFSISNASVYEYLKANKGPPFKWYFVSGATIARMVLVLFKIISAEVADATGAYIEPADIRCVRLVIIAQKGCYLGSFWHAYWTP